MARSRLAAPAVAAPIVFVTVVALLTAHEWDFLHRIGWKVWGKTNVPWPSSTALGSWGWLQVVNFVQLGIAVLALAVALRTALPRGRAASVARGALIVAGLSVVALAFKTDPDTSHIKTWHGAIHAAAFVVLVVASIVAMLSVWRTRWPPAARISLAASVLIVATTLVSFAWSTGSTVVGGISLLAILAWIELLALRIA
jgi:hypothetical protein